MLIREVKRLMPFLGPVLVLLFFVSRFYDKALVTLPSFDGAPSTPSSSESPEPEKAEKPDRPPQEVGHPIAGYTEGAYDEIFSVSTPDKKYFKIVFDKKQSINPNAIPHPFLDDTWVIVSQLQRSDVKNSVWFAELVCNAAFKDGNLSCVEAPSILPLTKTPGGEKCREKLAYFQLSVGPHDARVFYGPTTPYVIYGSTSQFTCFGEWMMDFRLMMDWGLELFDKEQFRLPTEIQRPKPYGVVEKNFFVFWDKNEELYGHYDIAPNRAFAQLSNDGSVGPDLAPKTAASDEKCMAKYFPKLDPETESIHQATNSLSITLCKRSDPACKPDDSNTFIMTIFQHKKWYNWHGVYEPYVMLFQQTAPFAVHGISTKPIWISGRGKPHEWVGANVGGKDQTQMFYVTSISWKKHGQKYHGYIDDVMFVLFGIEDADTGGIDVTAGDLVKGLGLCAS